MGRRRWDSDPPPRCELNTFLDNGFRLSPSLATDRGHGSPSAYAPTRDSLIAAQVAALKPIHVPLCLGDVSAESGCV